MTLARRPGCPAKWPCWIDLPQQLALLEIHFNQSAALKSEDRDHAGAAVIDSNGMALVEALSNRLSHPKSAA